MLINFSVENFKCFDSKASLALTASQFAQHEQHVIEMPSRLRGDGLLKLAAIYGANASGKTKLIDGLLALRRIVTRAWSPGAKLPVVPFKLSEVGRTSPVRFGITISNEGKSFEYGIVVSPDGKTILEEWLYSLSGSRQTRCFERVTSDGTVTVEIGTGFGKKNTNELRKLELIAEATGENQPFVFKAWENRSEVAGIFVRWFRDKLQIIGAEAVYEPLEFEAAKDEDFSTFLGEYLRAAGTGIDTIKPQEAAIDLNASLKSYDQNSREEALKDLEKGLGLMLISGTGSVSKIGKNEAGEIVEFKLMAGHTCNSADPVLFDFKEESHGTQRLTHLLPAMYQARTTQMVYVVDELDRKLHPLLTKKFIRDFADSSQQSRSQLVFTTHDTNLLDQEVLRRDEIWFVEKDCRTGGAEVRPLTDYDVRADLRLDKGYLNGRFGAIPFFGNCQLP